MTAEITSVNANCKVVNTLSLLKLRNCYPGECGVRCAASLLSSHEMLGAEVDIIETNFKWHFLCCGWVVIMGKWTIDTSWDDS